MSDSEDSFGKLFGTLGTDAEKQDLYRVLDALNIRRNDALLTVLYALHYYRVLYREIPGQIAGAAGSTLANIKQTAEATIKASAEKTKYDLTEHVKKESLALAHKAAQIQKIKWLGFGLGLGLFTAALAVCAALWVGFTKGRVAGLAQGYAQARDEKVAVAWAVTEEGKLARQLAKATDIKALVTCSNVGWEIMDGACYPREAEDHKIRGWKLP